MKKKRSIILISILIIVSVTIYFYKPQHNKNNSYQLGVIISMGNKDKSNIISIKFVDDKGKEIKTLPDLDNAS